MDDSRSHQAVDQVECYVDGLLPFDVMHTTHEAAAVGCGRRAARLPLPQRVSSSAASYASDTLTHGFWDVEHVVGVCAADAQWACAVAGRVGGQPDPDPITTARAVQADFVRDIFGNHFRPVATDPAWLTSTVIALAHGIYDEKAFDRLPILADALQDAGCDNDDVLNHCRQPGEHVRGCWVVDWCWASRSSFVCECVLNAPTTPHSLTLIFCLDLRKAYLSLSREKVPSKPFSSVNTISVSVTL